MNVTLLENFTEKCTGCSACSEACPVNALEMSYNDEGFLYPKLNYKKCIDCEKCIGVCQITQNPVIKEALKIQCGYACDDIVRASGSSGGFMVGLSEKFLEDGAIVYGAVFDANTKSIMHSSSKYHTISQLSRSKYVQSNLNHTYSSVKEDLISGHKVLFCGTPCQVVGLKKYLTKNYDNLYTIDFFCHGVPSPRLFNEQISIYEEKYGFPVEEFTFREKIYGWRNQSTRVRFSNGYELIEKSNNTPLYFFFLKNYSLRKSCMTCEYFNAHESDLTLADYWNTKNSDDKGESLILSNTKKGIDMVKDISDKFNIFDVMSFDYNIYKHDYSLRKRNEFFSVYCQKGSKFILTKYMKREKLKYDITAKVKKIILRIMKKED